MSWLQQAIQKIKHRPLMSLIFVTNLSVGLFALLVVLVFKSSIDMALQENSKELLGADVVVRGRRDLTSEELKKVRAILPIKKEVRVLTFYSMIKSEKRSKLVRVRAVPKGYPIYGEMILAEQKKAKNSDVANLQEHDNAWVYPELLTVLNLSVGEKIQLGKLSYTVSDVIEKDSAQAVSATAFAPTMVVGAERVKETGLIQFGSTIRYRYYFQLKGSHESKLAVKSGENTNGPAESGGVSGGEIDDFVEQINEAIPDSSIRVTGLSNSESRSGRMIKYLSDYLGLVSLVAVLLSLIGVTFLYREQLTRQAKDLAVFRAIGVSPKELPQYLNWQIVLLGFISLVVAIVLTTISLPYVEKEMVEFFPGQFRLKMTGAALLIVTFLAMGLPVLVMSPLVAQVKKLKPMLVFRDLDGLQWATAYRWFHVFGFFVLFSLLAMFISNSLKVGAAFSAVVAALTIVFIFSFRFLISLLRFISPEMIRMRWVALQVLRRPTTSLSWLIAVSLSAALLTLIPQLHQSLSSELAAGNDSQLPSFFLFDIQEEQLPSLKEKLDKLSISLEDESPLVRGRIINVNGKKFEKIAGETGLQTREEQRAAFFRNRGVNLSYRQGLSPSESILSGEPRSPTVNPDISEISVEHRFADRLDLGVGDTVEFDIQGVPIKAKVVNLRHVRWTSFKPNFFIQFQPGVLDAAPKTFIATVSGLSRERLVDVQSAVVEEFPNISMVNVFRLVERILALTKKMGWIIGVMAVLALLCGLIVQFAIFVQQSEARQTQVGMLKALGVRPSVVSILNMAEVLVLSLLAVCSGVLVSWLLNYLAASYLFNTVTSFHPHIVITATVGLTVFSLVVGGLALLPALRAKPWTLLR